MLPSVRFEPTTSKGQFPKNPKRTPSLFSELISQRNIQLKMKYQQKTFFGNKGFDLKVLSITSQTKVHLYYFLIIELNI